VLHSAFSNTNNQVERYTHSTTVLMILHVHDKHRVHTLDARRRHTTRCHKTEYKKVVVTSLSVRTEPVLTLLPCLMVLLLRCATACAAAKTSAASCCHFLTALRRRINCSNMRVTVTTVCQYGLTNGGIMLQPGNQGGGWSSAVSYDRTVTVLNTLYVNCHEVHLTQRLGVHCRTFRAIASKQ
jgi:hypothetical protein